MPTSRSAIYAASLLVAWLLLPAQRIVAAPRVVHIGFVVDGPWERNTEVMEQMRAEMRALVRDQFDLRFPDDKVVVGDWTLPTVEAALRRLVADPEVDLVVALGILSSDRACRGAAPTKPIIAPAVIDAKAQGMPSRDGTSGVHNLTYLSVPTALERDLRTFHDLVSFRHLGVFANQNVTTALPVLRDSVLAAASRVGVEARFLPMGTSAEQTLAHLPAEIDAIYLMPLLQLSAAAWDSLVAGLTARRLPTFSSFGEKEVQRGVLAGISPDIFPQMARRLAVTVQRILSGEDAGKLPTGIVIGERLMINARTARAIGWYPSWAGLSEAEVFGEAEPRGQTLTLVASMQEALLANLDLAAAVAQTRAGAAQVVSARSVLLPQADASLLGAQIDADRAGASFGSQAERSLVGTLQGSQLLFSEPDLARWSSERSLQRARERDLDQTRLDTAGAAGAAHLDVLRAKTLERIRKENLQLTRRHLETARLLESVGTTGRSDVYRWESELATNRKEAIEANAARNLAEIELNRILHRPAEEPFIAAETDLEDPEVARSLAPSLPYFDDKISFSVLRAFLVEEGLSTSPELQSFDAAIAASRRQLQSATRAFFLPQLSFQASWSSAWSKDGAGSEPAFVVPGVPQTDDIDWSLGLLAAYPLSRGGGRFAVRAQAREELSSLELQRQSAAERIEQRIRAAVHRAGASYAGMREARSAAEWAQRNLDLVTDGYARGATSFINLLDAQNAHVVSEQSAANAVYDFLDDWLEVQRAIGRFDFTRSDSERESFRQRLEEFVARAGARRP
uniref:Outer membrane efflux protein n=1 Tax=uncultured bacterium F42-01 TaxID=1191438 RepID=I3VIL3_9BACT|nr:outer membrane efflux protein [uncultured bacterium F42-01]